MARTRSDHDARRREVSAAVWRVLAGRGFGGLTMRAVAAESGATTGLLTHYFTDKRDLTDHALDLLDRRVAERRSRPSGDGVAALRAALLAMLPLTEDSTVENRIWIASWDLALADPEIAAGHAGRYARSRERLAEMIRRAQDAGELDPGDPAALAAHVQAFVLGLAVQAVLDPKSFSRPRQRRLVDGLLATLGAQPR